MEPERKQEVEVRRRERGGVHEVGWPRGLWKESLVLGVCPVSFLIK